MNEPTWPDTWRTTCPAPLRPDPPSPTCGAYLQGGPHAFHAHWLVVHAAQPVPADFCGCHPNQPGTCRGRNPTND